MGAVSVRQLFIGFLECPKGASRTELGGFKLIEIGAYDAHLRDSKGVVIASYSGFGLCVVGRQSSGTAEMTQCIRGKYLVNNSNS